MVYAFISSIAKGYRTSAIATVRKFTLLGREHPYPLCFHTYPDASWKANHDRVNTGEEGWYRRQHEHP